MLNLVRSWWTIYCYYTSYHLHKKKLPLFALFVIVQSFYRLLEGFLTITKRKNEIKKDKTEKIENKLFYAVNMSIQRNIIFDSKVPKQVFWSRKSTEVCNVKILESQLKHVPHQK